MGRDSGSGDAGRGAPARPRVLHLVGSLLPYGAERSVLNVAEAMATRYESVVAALADGPLRSALSGRDVACFVHRETAPSGRGWLGRKVDVLSSAAFVLATARRVRPHLIHCHSPEVWVAGLLAGALLRAPVVLHVRSPYPRLGLLDCVLPIRLLRHLTRLRVVVNSRATGTAFQARTGLPGAIVPSGVDRDGLLMRSEGADRLRRELCLPEDAFVIAVVARLDPVKNHDCVLRCAARTAQRLANVRFLCAGDGPEAEPLKRLARERGLGDVVTWLGYRDDAPRFMALADVVMLLSRREGFGRVLVEAMLLSKPLVATDVPAISELVNDGVEGFLVPDDGDQAASEALLHLAGDAGLARAMGAAGLRRASERYLLPAIADALEPVYADLTARSRCRHDGA